MSIWNRLRAASKRLALNGCRPSRMANPRIFSSYRRDESIGHAGRLFDRLAQEFGQAAANEEQVRLLP